MPDVEWFLDGSFTILIHLCVTHLDENHLELKTWQRCEGAACGAGGAGGHQRFKSPLDA